MVNNKKHEIYNQYDSMLSWSSLWIIYSAAYHSIDNFLEQCLCFLTISTGIASFLHWRFFNNKPLFYIDVTLSSTVFSWHIIYNPNKYVLSCAFFAIIFFYLSCVLKCRYRTAENNLKMWYLLIHPSFRFFAFWMVMIAHGNDFPTTLIFAYWLSIFTISLAPDIFSVKNFCDFCDNFLVLPGGLRGH